MSKRETQGCELHRDAHSNPHSASPTAGESFAAIRSQSPGQAKCRNLNRDGALVAAFPPHRTLGLAGISGGVGECWMWLVSSLDSALAGEDCPAFPIPHTFLSWCKENESTPGNELPELSCKYQQSCILNKSKHLPVPVQSAFSVKKFLPWKQPQKSLTGSVNSAFCDRKLLSQEQVQWECLCFSSISQAGAQWEVMTALHPGTHPDISSA